MIQKRKIHLTAGLVTVLAIYLKRKNKEFTSKKAYEGDVSLWIHCFILRHYT